MNNQIYASHGEHVGADALSQGAVHGQRGALTSVVESALIRFFDRVLTWRENARSRHALARLDDHMLSDLGLSRAQAEFEASTPFWR